MLRGATGCYGSPPTTTLPRLAPLQLVFKVEVSELGALGPAKNWIALAILALVSGRLDLPYIAAPKSLTFLASRPADPLPFQCHLFSSFTAASSWTCVDQLRSRVSAWPSACKPYHRGRFLKALLAFLCFQMCRLWCPFARPPGGEAFSWPCWPYCVSNGAAFGLPWPPCLAASAP